MGGPGSLSYLGQNGPYTRHALCSNDSLCSGSGSAEPRCQRQAQLGQGIER